MVLIQPLCFYPHAGIMLVGGFKHFLFSIIYGMSSFPLTNIFQDVKTTNQLQYMFPLFFLMSLPFVGWFKAPKKSSHETPVLEAYQKQRSLRR